MASRKKGVAPERDVLEREHPDTGVRAAVRVGDCRTELERFDEAREGRVDLVFADPPFNWARAYDRWDDKMPEDEYLTFTYDWLDLCVRALRPGGALWVNIPDDWAAEITAYLKGRLWIETPGREPAGRKPPAEMEMENWCVWHYRFGQNVTERFINSKVHALYFVKAGGERTWNPTEVLEVSDRRAIYGDPRTENKRDGMPAGLRVPMDVWYGKFWGRIQGNNKERRAQHDNQLPEVYLERVVRACSNPGDVVLDPFTGSGTTGVVAHALGRHFIGTEFSPENAARAFERIGLGPVRELGQGPQSTAIFERRRSKDGPTNRAADGPAGASDGVPTPTAKPRKPRRKVST